MAQTTTSSLRRNSEAQGKELIRFDNQISEPGVAVSKETLFERITVSSEWTSLVVLPPPPPTPPAAAHDFNVDPASGSLPLLEDEEHNLGYMGSIAKDMSAVENWR